MPALGMTMAVVAMLAMAGCAANAGTAAASPAAPARASSDDAAPGPLVGTWSLVAADDLHPDGHRAPAYGEHPRGLLIIDADGRYSLQIFRAGRPAFAAGVKSGGTSDEFRAAVMGMSSHVGHCAIDPATHTLDFQIELASYPNWEGTVQKRQFTLEGGVLSYQVPASASATGLIPISVWRRVR